MPPRSTDTGWGALVHAFHSSIEILILAQVALGLAKVRMGLTPAKLRVFEVHKSIGVTTHAIPLSGRRFNSATNAPLAWFGVLDVPSLTGGSDAV